MKFEKIKDNEKIEYYINDKPVDENTYNILLKDESVNKLPLQKKLSQEDYHSIEFDINDNDGDLCSCPECQNIHTIVQFIQNEDTDYNDAFIVLSDYIESIKVESVLGSMAQFYNEMGNTFIKNAGKLERDLEDYYSDIEAIDDDFDS